MQAPRLFSFHRRGARSHLHLDVNVATGRHAQQTAGAGTRSCLCDIPARRMHCVEERGGAVGRGGEGKGSVPQGLP